MPAGNRSYPDRWSRLAESLSLRHAGLSRPVTRSRRLSPIRSRHGCSRWPSLVGISLPRGNNEEGFTDDRHACFFDLDTWRDYVTSAGFEEVGHYYRPPGLPRHKQPWLATVWRKAQLPHPNG